MTTPRIPYSTDFAVPNNMHYLTTRVNNETLFDTMIENGDSQIHNVLLSPLMSNDKNSTDTIAQPKKTKYFFDNINYLLDNGVRPLNVIKLFAFNYNGNVTVGHYLADNDHLFMQSYLAFFPHCINVCKNNGGSAQEMSRLLKAIVKVLSIRDAYGCTLVYVLAKNNNDIASIRAHISNLDIFRQNGLANKDILALIMIESYYGWTLGHAVARNGNMQCMLELLKLLSSTMKDGVDAQSMIESLEIKTDAGWTLGHAIGAYREKEILRDYLLLVTQCFRKDFLLKQRIYNLLMLPSPKNDFVASEKNILSAEIHKNDPQILFLIVKTGLLADKDYNTLVQHKQTILDYIRKLPKEERDLELKHASDLNHPLGKLIRLNAFTPKEKKVPEINTKPRLSTRATLNSIFQSTMANHELTPVYIPVHQMSQSQRNKAIEHALTVTSTKGLALFEVNSNKTEHVKPTLEQPTLYNYLNSK